jgi:uncharacterized protein
MHSALFHGEVMHQRLRPRLHKFCYQLSSWLIDIDELPELARLRGFAWNRPSLFSFYDSDYGYADGRSPRQFIDELLMQQGLARPARVELLCQVRCLGIVFNPLAVWFCYDAQGQLMASLYEVRNTFKQRHHYLVPINSAAPPTQGVGEQARFRQQADKVFYVSPFMPMACQYQFSFKAPSEQLDIGIAQQHEGTTIMHAHWRGRRQPLDQRALNWQGIRHPLNTLWILLAIHWQAIRLWLKRVPLVARPEPPTQAVSRGQMRPATTDQTTHTQPPRPLGVSITEDAS